MCRLGMPRLCRPVGEEPRHPGGQLRRAAYPGRMDDYWQAVLWSLLPTLVVLGIFFVVLRNIIRADRTERSEYARIEAEERAKRGLPAAGGAGASSIPAEADAAGDAAR